MDNLFLNTMLDFELIKNEEVIKDINVSNKNESTDNLILTNKRLIKIKKEKHKTQLNAVSIENIQGIEYLCENNSPMKSVDFNVFRLIFALFRQKIH